LTLDVSGVGFMGVPSLNSAHSVASQHDTDDCVERKYTMLVATLFFKFSRSDSVVAEMMANCDAGVIKVIIDAISSPELRAHPSVPFSFFPSSPLQTVDNMSYVAAVASTLSSVNLTAASTAEPSHSSTSSKRRNSRSNGGLLPAYIEIIELLLKCCKNLSMEPSILADLDKAGIIEALIPLLQGPISERCKNHVLPCIFNMCRINKKRQEKAAQLGTFL